MAQTLPKITLGGRSSDDEYSSSSDSSYESESDKSSSSCSSGEEDSSSSDSDSDREVTGRPAFCKRMFAASSYHSKTINLRKGFGAFSSKTKDVDEDDDDGPLLILNPNGEYIPVDILKVIFSFVKSRNVQRWNIVCREWYDVIMLDDSFWKYRADRLIETFDPNDSSISKKRALGYSFGSTTTFSNPDEQSDGENKKQPNTRDPFPDYYPHREKCIWLETEKNHCVLCNISNYSYSRVEFNFCNRCVNSKAFESSSRLINLGLSYHTLRKFSFGHSRIFMRALYYYLGRGSLTRGRKAIDKLKDKACKRDKERFQEQLEEKNSWLRALIDELKLNELDEEAIDLIAHLHANDHLLSKSFILQEYCDYNRKKLKMPTMDYSNNLSYDKRLRKQQEEEAVYVQQMLRTTAKEICNDRGFPKCKAESSWKIVRVYTIGQIYECAISTMKDILNKSGRCLTHDQKMKLFSLVFERHGSKAAVSNCVTEWFDLLESEEKMQEIKQKMWNKFEDLLQIESNGKFTLHDEIPRISREHLEGILNKNKEEVEISSPTVVNFIGILERELGLKQAIEEYGFEYNTCPIPTLIRQYVENLGGHHSISNIYSAASYMINKLKCVVATTPNDYWRGQNKLYHEDPELARKQLAEDPVVLGSREVTKAVAGYTRKLADCLKRNVLGKRAHTQISEVKEACKKSKQATALKSRRSMRKKRKYSD